MRVFSFIGAFVLCASVLYAQEDWYEPNQTYTFESLSGDDSTVVIQLEVVYNSDGNCVITKQTYTADSNDSFRGTYFGSEDAYSVSNDSIYFNPEAGQKFYIIPFDTYQSLSVGASAKIICNCTHLIGIDGDCPISISYSGNGYILNAICIRNWSCLRCKGSVSTGAAVYDEGFLIIEANGSLTLNGD